MKVGLVGNLGRICVGWKGGAWHMIRSLWNHAFRVGDPVVFRMAKHGTRPSIRALNVSPAPFGEEYFYEVEKYWMVEHVDEHGVTVRTRRGKRHVIGRNDPRLRPAHWWERIFLKGRFPEMITPLRSEEQPDEGVRSKV